MAEEPTPKRFAWGCLTLFGLPFVAAGVIATIAAARANDWPQIGFGALFIAAGVGIMLAGPLAAAASRRRAAREESAPDRPWTWRDDWSSGRIAGSTIAAAGVHWILGVFWLGISVPIAWLLFHDRHAPVFFQGIFGVGFPVIGVLLLVAGIRGALRRHRFGRSWLTLDSVPAPPGGALSGRIDCGVPDQIDPTFRLVLHCTETWMENRGKSSSSKTEVLWRDEYECLGERSAEVADGSQVPVRFDLPAEMPPCGKGTRGKISWQLAISSEVPGVDYRDGFEVPVFPLAAGTTAPAPRERPQPPPSQRLATGRLRIAEDGIETRVTFPPAMNPGLAAVPTGLLAVTGFMTWAWAQQGMWWAAVPVGAFAAAMLWAAGRAWLMRTTIIARRGEIEVERSLLGIAWRRTWRSGEVEDIDLSSDFSANGDPWQKIAVKGAANAKLGSLINSQGIASRARDALRQRLKGDR